MFYFTLYSIHHRDWYYYIVLCISFFVVLILMPEVYITWPAEHVTALVVLVHSNSNWTDRNQNDLQNKKGIGQYPSIHTYILVYSNINIVVTFSVYRRPLDRTILPPPPGISTSNLNRQQTRQQTTTDNLTSGFILLLIRICRTLWSGYYMVRLWLPNCHSDADGCRVLAHPCAPYSG